MTVPPTEFGFYKGEFDRTGNPLFALRAFQIARANDIEPPDWVMDHLERSVENIFSVEEPPKSNVGNFIAEAFGFTIGKGKPSAFSEYRRQEQATGIYLAVVLHIAEVHQCGRHDKLYIAFEEVAKELGISRSTVERNYNEIHNHIASL